MTKWHFNHKIVWKQWTFHVFIFHMIQCFIFLALLLYWQRSLFSFSFLFIRFKTCCVCVHISKYFSRRSRKRNRGRNEENMVRWMKEQPSIHWVRLSQRDNSSLSLSSPTAADIFLQIIIIYILIKNHHYVDHLHPNEKHLHGNHSRVVLWQPSRQIKRQTDRVDRLIDKGKVKWNQSEQMGISLVFDSLWHLYFNQWEISPSETPVQAGLIKYIALWWEPLSCSLW